MTKIRYKKNQIDWLDLMRVFAMLIVFALHLSQRVIHSKTIAGLFSNMGCAGVCIFFVLSGYLIPTSYERSKTIKIFYIKRAFRILPVYYVILLANALFRTMPTDVIGLGWWRYILCINMVVPAYETVWNSIAGFWTISMFVFYYLLVPAICRFCNSWRICLATAIVANSVATLALKGLRVIFQGYFNGNLDFIDRSFLRMFPIFLLGTVALYARQEKKERETMCVLAIYMFLLRMVGVKNDYFFFGLLVMFFIMNMDSCKLYISEKWDAAIKILGGYSFLVYMVHLSVFDAMDSFGLKENTNLILYSLVGIAFVALVVIMLHNLIEIPMIKIEKSLLKSISIEPLKGGKSEV